jgi:hypothetical protein
METNSDIGSLSNAPVLEPQIRMENAPRVVARGWDPYEVWWTQVRAVQMARASKIESPPPVLQHEVLQHEPTERLRKADFSEAARNVVLAAARTIGSLKVGGVLHSLGYRRW